MKRLYVRILAVALLGGVGVVLGSNAFASGGVVVNGCPCHGAMKKTQAQLSSQDGLLQSILENLK